LIADQIAANRIAIATTTARTTFIRAERRICASAIPRNVKRKTNLNDEK
jgi:hypothetical protein